MKRRLTFLGFTLVLFMSAYPFKMDKLKLLASLNTPDKDFSGTVTINANNASPWVCFMGNGYIIEVIPALEDDSGLMLDSSITFRLYSDEDETCPQIIEEVKIQVPNDTRHSGLKIYSDGNIKLFTNKGIDVFEGSTLRPLKPCSKIKIMSVDKEMKINTKSDFINKARPLVDLPNVIANVSFSPVGVWVYLDEETPTQGYARVGNHYKLAIIADPNVAGAYIICHSEDTVNYGRGDVKGFLKPTSFAAHYDLTWYDRDGYPVGNEDCYANLEGSNLLTLVFPLLKSQIRFQRFHNH